MREIVETNVVPTSTSPVSLGTKGAGMVWVSGQMPRDPTTGLIPTDPKQQAELSLRHCIKILEAAGSGPEKVMIVWIYVTDLQVKQAVNAAFRDIFGTAPPARNLVAVKDIGDNAVVEMSLIALA